MSTGERTQQPSYMPSRAGSPPGDTPPAEGATAMMKAPPPPAGKETALTTYGPFDLNTIKTSGNFIFHLHIKGVMAAQPNYKPINACSNLNSLMQDSLATHSGVADIPTSMYDVTYSPPSPGAAEGTYICQIPAVFEELVKSAQVISDLEFTGDGKGNNYKLEYADYTPFVNKGKRPTNEHHWLHVTPNELAICMPTRKLYEGTNRHLNNFGMAIQEHEWAFVPKLSKDKEHQDKRRFHCEYDLNHDLVPIRNGFFNVKGLNTVVFDSDIPDATGTIWIRPDLLEKIFGACHVCYQHKSICLGHDPRPPQSKTDGKRPATAADKEMAAKRRMAEAAAKKGQFKF
jgi:hypothetical protein